MTNTTVIGLHLPYQNVAGTLPPSLCDLTGLQEMSMRGNIVTGPIPECVGALTKLGSFDFSEHFGAGFTGPVPQSISNCKELTVFKVGGHQLGGGALLPAMPFENMGTGGNCQLFDSYRHGRNRFRCPWPAGVTTHCFNLTDINKTELFAPVTDADCSLYSCDASSGQCVESPSGKQSSEDCVASCKAPVFSCNRTTGQCTEDTQGTMTAHECTTTCLPAPTAAPTPTPTPAPRALSPAVSILGVASALLSAALLFVLRRKGKRGLRGWPFAPTSDIEAPLLHTSVVGAPTPQQRLDGAQRRVADLVAASEEADAEVEAARVALVAEAATRAAAAAAAATAAAAAAAAAVTVADGAARGALRRSREPQAYSPAQMERATGGFSDGCKIDEGKFSAVYHGRLQPSGREVAIKLLKVEAAAYVPAQKKHEQFVGVGSFYNELKVLRKYRHQNIVQLLGFCLTGEDDEDESKGGGSGGTVAPPQCLVLEWVAGGSLRKRLDGNDGALTPQQRFDIASDVARGLEYLHITADPPIIHQDVKSDNVLLDEVGGKIVAKVADFGTAREVSELLEGRAHHSTQMVIGTRGYMPAEYANGQVSDKTDTYAFGVVLCELLTGLLPVDDQGEVLATTMSSVLADAKRKLPPLLDKHTGCGERWPMARTLALGRVAQQCIEIRVADRCLVAERLPELDRLAGRKEVRRAGRGQEYDGMTGKLVTVVRAQ
jgi:hypothetical protein